MDTQIKMECRIDPTSLLPEEPMSYEIKKKKKKKRKKQDIEDPLKDCIVHVNDPVKIEYDMTPDDVDMPDVEVKIEAEQIEVELNFEEFTNDNGESFLESSFVDDDYQPTVSLSDTTNKEALILTYKDIKQEKPEKIKTETDTSDQYDETCKFCHLVFKNPRTLRIHQIRKHDLKRKSFIYKCKHCGVSYEHKSSLDVHVRRKHGPNSEPEDNVDRVCDICALVFKGARRLRMHMQRKHSVYDENFKYVCSDCGLTYPKYCSLVVHRKRKHLNVKPKLMRAYKCPLCPSVLTNRDTYSRHMQRKHHRSNEDEGLSGELFCKHCPLAFANTKYLKLHMRRKHNEFVEDFSLKCKLCNLSYNLAESLKRHVRRKHSGNLFCETCQKQFESEEKFANHTHGKNYMECGICNQLFASQSGLSKHLRCTHKIDSGPKNFNCKLCSTSFRENRQLKKHILREHLNVTYPCKYCAKIFKTKESNNKHLLRVHSTEFDVQIHKCADCVATFDNEHALCKHIQLVHKNDENIKKEILIKTEAGVETHYKCTKCTDVYTNFDELRQHNDRSHVVVEDVQCDVCGEHVPSKDMTKHMKTQHPVEVNMKCSYCDFETTSKASLTQHTIRHKNATSITCDYTGCKYKTFYQTAMDKHKKKHEETVVLQCIRCPFQTMNKYILRYHEEEHMTGKKKYNCDKCNYSTIMPANLVQHKYKHADVKRFKCEMCPFATKYNTSLRFHIRKKHCDLPIKSEESV